MIRPPHLLHTPLVCSHPTKRLGLVVCAFGGVSSGLDRLRLTVPAVPLEVPRRSSPKVERCLKLPILDRTGYDVASTSVHPMADDGKDEFQALLKLPTEQYGDDRTVLHNSVLVQYLLVERGMSGCDLLWRNFVNDFLENWFAFVETSNIENLQACVRILTLAASNPDLPWCENKPTLARGGPNYGSTR